jgi:SRSO17 transposase
MKSPHDSTPAQVGPGLREISACSQHLRSVHERLRPHFARPQTHQHALLYLQAVLSDIPRKNGWQIAEQARQTRPYGIQRLLSAAVWDQEAVRDELRALLCQTLCPPPEPSGQREQTAFPVLVLDESGFPKRGRHSAGVASQ